MTPSCVVGLYTPDLDLVCMASAAPMSARHRANFGRLIAPQRHQVRASSNRLKQNTFNGARPMRKLMDALGDVADVIGGLLPAIASFVRREVKA